MGANAQTTVPTFTSGQTLTAAQVNQINTGIPVFATTTTRDAAFGGSGEKTLALGQLCFLESTSKVQFYNGTSWANLTTVTNVEEFTSNGSWVVPADVTYAIAHIRAGGGGGGTTGAGNGGNSSVVFPSGTVTATGGNAVNFSATNAIVAVAGAANSGEGALFTGTDSNDRASGGNAPSGAYIVHGATVTPAGTVTVTVGAGGTAGTSGAAGGSGYVWIEYQV